ncbi:MAG: ornithine carbamoyltransferase [Syntrophobacterales bacterium]|nr:MAG: ornithine carbamoyltransferase [Syntrophobacterales bacterium]
MKRDLVSIFSLNQDEIDYLMGRAAVLKAQQREGVRHTPLKGKTLGMIFEKASTRTRVSFEVGMYQMGGYALFLDFKDIQLSRGEAIADTARVLSRYMDGIMARTFSHEAIEELARHTTVPVINGLSDLLHPCQVLSDIFTVMEKMGGYRGVKVAYVGDGNNVAHSWINCAAKLAFQLSLACPKGYGPDPSILERARRESRGKIQLVHDPYEAVSGADIIYTDVWASMGKEDEHADRLRDFRDYQVNSRLVKAGKTGVLVMHCLPAHRGEEITDEVMDGDHCIVWDQTENRLHVQKAILEWLMG